MRAENAVTVSSIQQSAASAQRITVAHGVLFVIGVAAAIMRLTGLDATPLNSAKQLPPCLLTISGSQAQQAVKRSVRSILR